MGKTFNGVFLLHSVGFIVHDLLVNDLVQVTSR